MSVTTVFLVAFLSTQAPGTVQLADGWEQVDAESYHGPEGWYHDRVSGALVRYWAGRMPNEAGVGPPAGLPCVVVGSDATPPPCVLGVTGRELQIFIGPYVVRAGLAPVPLVSMMAGDGAYASYWATCDSTEQMHRVQEFALANPLSRRLYSGHKMLDRDARESDLSAVGLGMSIYDVLRFLGDPLRMESLADGGFVMEFVVWGKWPLPNGKLTSASRTVKLTFSRERQLLKRPRARPPSNERTKPD